MKKIILISILSLITFFSCDLENFDTTGSLHPPLGLTLASSNNTVYASFWALNDEVYFTGYNVFIGDSETDVSNLSFPLSNSVGQLPFYSTSAFTYAKQITVAISNKHDGSALSGGATYFFGITAYDNIEADNSHLSEIVSVVVN